MGGQIGLPRRPQPSSLLGPAQLVLEDSQTRKAQDLLGSLARTRKYSEGQSPGEWGLCGSQPVTGQAQCYGEQMTLSLPKHWSPHTACAICLNPPNHPCKTAYEQNLINRKLRCGAIGLSKMGTVHTRHHGIVPPIQLHGIRNFI